jgi:uncharacterized protein YukE
LNYVGNKNRTLKMPLNKGGVMLQQTMHMQTEVVEDAQKTMVKMHEAMITNLAEITKCLDNINNANGWLGDSATQFFNQYDGLKAAMEAKLAELNDLSSAMLAEIGRWKAQAESFSS